MWTEKLKLIGAFFRNEFLMKIFLKVMTGEQ